MVVKEPSLLKIIITSINTNDKNAIYTDVHTKKGIVRALINSRSKLDLIDSEIV